MFRFLALFVALSFGLAASTPQGKVFHTAKEGLKLSFGAAKVERRSIVLTKGQRARIEARAGTKLRSSVIRLYQAIESRAADAGGKRESQRKGGPAKPRILGTAYFDVHRVRTMREVLMLVVTPDHRIKETRVMSFGDPVMYIPPQAWYKQLVSRKLDKTLQLNRGVDGFSGATLTARATTRCARRVLAIHQELFPLASKSESSSKPSDRPSKRAKTKTARGKRASGRSDERGARKTR